MPISSKPYGKLADGQTATLYTLTNAHGLSAEITNYGGIIVRLKVPDREGKFDDVVLGKDRLEDYVAGHPHFGAITGRVAGRIGRGKFTVDGTPYQLEINNGPNALHGGLKGYDKCLWSSEIIQESHSERLKLSLTDPDGANGFPGTVNCSVTYSLRDDNTLEIYYEASADKTTPFNITNHSYFNLKGSGDILSHQIQLHDAAEVAPIDAEATLLGRKESVSAGYNDFREAVVLSELKLLDPGNADIYYFHPDGRTRIPKLVATVFEPSNGRKMEALTTEPGVQFYAGLALSLEAPEIGKQGLIHGPMTGLCLETQDYADSVNFPDLGGALLHPGDNFRSTTLYRFSVDN